MSNPPSPSLDQLLGTPPPPGLGLDSIQAMRWGAKHPPKDPQASFAGKVVMISGANSGIGYHAAEKFAKLGASKVILAVRTPAKGNMAKEQIEAAMGCSEKSNGIVVMQLDMDDFQSVKQFATKLEEEVAVDGLDVAILNAGILAPNYTAIESTGWESTLQVNVLSTALLAIRLMPLLKRAAERNGQPSQLTMTSSAGSLSVTPADIPTDVPSILQALNEPGSFGLRSTYVISKLLVLYIMRGLVDDYSEPVPPNESMCGNTHPPISVAVNVICPGYTVTNIGRGAPYYITVMNKLLQLYGGRSAEQGSRSLVSAALLGVHGHGKFWSHDTFVDQGYMVTSEEGQKLQARIWKEIHGVCMKELE
ncbi:uncharacterized protein ACLA_061530 [Aspergillus clavatus NRRL 1]|uniref:NAD(P)-binding protein n=1 Tax=Aspergillus clavatus (strain ATCC 1007 / CBS 513.65 / DSM 816 / NCTC 3887 / NRRL 1 / QM 1276 / 107) TaxID=344612 RepID=A1CCD4_ASPCL|nr:uncharacterized protein ACLA_061530 [Aspergillus clavatus NRRL 1]EAW12191.1 hypothetical protein ACLA_061530 [Aspergillus clavatus NRRL 1]